MNNKLGSIIGKINHVFSITNHAKETVKLAITFDFSTSTDAEIKSWLVSDRTIAFQRPTRLLSADEINDLDGSTILAVDAGKKTISKAERVNALVAMGIPIELATMAIENPASFAQIMATIKPKTE